MVADDQQFITSNLPPLLSRPRPPSDFQDDYENILQLVNSRSISLSPSNIIANSMAEKSTGLSRLVQERALSRKEAEDGKRKQQENLIPYLPKDCISSILVRLPLESLQRSRFVCKPWYKIINSSTFIDAHFGRSENVLIFVTKFMQEASHPFSVASIPQEKPNTFSVEAKLFQLGSVPVFQQPFLDPRSKYHIQFMEIRDGKSKIEDFNITCLGGIRASCNGMIVLDNKLKKGGLVVMNPVTRKLTVLPSGTIYPPHDESYGFAYCSSTSQYRLVHLFRDELRYIGCEILNLGARSWRVVDGPSFGVFSWFGYEPVSAIGALHWIPHLDHNEYIVSMSMDDEKFRKIPLPKSSRPHDRIVEMGEVLCFATHEDMIQIDIWILRSLCEENWTKHHSIITPFCNMIDMIPLYCTRINDEMVFQSSRKRSLHAYDFNCQAIKEVEVPKGCTPILSKCLPHVNSLISWQIQENGDSVDE